MQPIDPKSLVIACIEGYREALKRYKQVGPNAAPEQAFKPLMECMQWAVIIDLALAEDQGEDWREGMPEHGLMEAVRFARNGMHHQLFIALRPKGGGVTIPTPIPAVFEPPVRCWINDPPEDLRPRGRDQYMALFADKPVIEALDNVSNFLDKLLEAR